MKGKFGRIVDLDTASGRCDVKLAEDGTVHEVMDKVLQIIPDKEYTEETRVISELPKLISFSLEPFLDKTAVDKYKKDAERREAKEEAKLPKQIQQKLSISCDEDDDEIQVIGKKSSPPWPVPDLVVRVISKTYKDKRYYKEKMVVVDASAKNCIDLRDDRGKMHSEFYFYSIFP